MSIAWIISLSVFYLVLSVFGVWYMQGRFRGSILEKLVTIVSTLGCFFVLFFIAGPLSIPYFWLYRERHATTIDFDGTDDEKAELASYRAALRRETLWSRFMYCTGLRSASANRVAAQQAITQTWQRFHERTRHSTSDEHDIRENEGEQNAGGNGS